MKIITVISTMMLIAGCSSPAEPPPPDAGTGGSGSSSSASSASSSSGGVDAPKGTSPTIESFQAIRAALHKGDPSVDVIEAQTASASMVDISPEAENERVFYVLNWSIDSVEQTLAQMANVTFDRGGAPRTQAEAEAVSKAFELAASEVLDALSTPSWSAEWTTFMDDAYAAQASIKRPAEWEHASYNVQRGALKCMKIIAIQGGATTMQEAMAANGGAIAILLKAENGAFSDLAAITGK